jgi:NADH-quinone oxidoreductase subunit C
MTAAEAADRLQEHLTLGFLNKVEFRGEITVRVAPETAKEALRFCRDELGFDCLLDISSLDHLGSEPRFEVVYELYSCGPGLHLRVKCAVPDETGKIVTVCDLWPGANWHEREVYDMMGIEFSGHPDLRRILMWEGYPYFPLRKDFPLAGKESEVPDVAFTSKAPLQGGPFVTVPSTGGVEEREPRSRESN